MKYIDSNILAYAFYENEHTKKCQEVIREGGMTNTFNLAEAFFIITKETGNKELAKKAIKGLMKSDIQIVDVTVSLIFEALKKIEDRELSIFDAVHYASAQMHNCESILTYDADFDKTDIPREEP